MRRHTDHPIVPINTLASARVAKLVAGGAAALGFGGALVLVRVASSDPPTGDLVWAGFGGFARPVSALFFFFLRFWFRKKEAVALDLQVAIWEAAIPFDLQIPMPTPIRCFIFRPRAHTRLLWSRN